MAVSSSAYFSNAIVGVPQAGGDMNIYQQDLSPKFAIGTKFERQDGCVFRYAHFGAACSRGQIVTPDLLESAVFYTANCLMATASAFQQTMERAGLYPNMSGSRFVVAHLSSVTADTYAGGYLSISSGTGLGYTYRIRGNQASNGTSCIFELYETLQAGCDNTSDISIAPSKYANLQPCISGTTDLSIPVGIACISISTAWGWIQTKGLCGVSCASSLNHAYKAIVSTLDAGEAAEWGEYVSGATQLALASELAKHLEIGKVVLATATSGHAVIDLALE